MTDYFTVERGCSRFGLERVHLARMGGRVPREAIDELVGTGKIVAILEYEEPEIRVWHLRVYWRKDERNHGNT